MRVKKLKLKQFRNYDALELTLDPGVNLFFGPNGSGKTNLLEAVHYCALGRSHRTAQDREVIARDCEMGACGVTMEKRDGVHDVAVKMHCASATRFCGNTAGSPWRRMRFSPGRRPWPGRRR